MCGYKGYRWNRTDTLIVQQKVINPIGDSPSSIRMSIYRVTKCTLSYPSIYL
jgi:hypothetical protein